MKKGSNWSVFVVFAFIWLYVPFPLNLLWSVMFLVSISFEVSLKCNVGQCNEMLVEWICWIVFPPFLQWQRGRDWLYAMHVVRGSNLHYILICLHVQFLCHIIWQFVIIKKGENVGEWLPHSYVLINDQPICTNLFCSTNIS